MLEHIFPYLTTVNWNGISAVICCQSAVFPMSLSLVCIVLYSSMTKRLDQSNLLTDQSCGVSYKIENSFFTADVIGKSDA